MTDALDWFLARCGESCGTTSGFLSGDVSSLLGGVLNGEALRSDRSPPTSGAARLLDFLRRVGGLTGTFGFAARLTLGGTAGLSGFRADASVDGWDVVVSAEWSKAFMRASRAGVAALLMVLA